MQKNENEKTPKGPPPPAMSPVDDRIKILGHFEDGKFHVDDYHAPPPRPQLWLYVWEGPVRSDGSRTCVAQIAYSEKSAKEIIVRRTGCPVANALITEMLQKPPRKYAEMSGFWIMRL